MDAPLTPNVLDSPAVAILCALEADGFTVQLEPDNCIVIIPRSRLTADRMAEITRYKDALRLLLRCCDAGVTARVAEFRRQLAVPGLPAFVFSVNTAYVKGICFSCADSLNELRFGRCWRCSLAWRLSCRLQIPAMLGDVLDRAKVCA